MFKPDRIYSERNPGTGRIEWFFHTREGAIGPYESKDTAQRMLEEFVFRCRTTRNDGGRSKKSSSSLSLAPLNDDPTVMIFDPCKRKRGVEGS